MGRWGAIIDPVMRTVCLAGLAGTLEASEPAAAGALYRRVLALPDHRRSRERARRALMRLGGGRQIRARLTLPAARWILHSVQRPILKTNHLIALLVGLSVAAGCVARTPMPAPASAAVPLCRCAVEASGVRYHATATVVRHAGGWVIDLAIDAASIDGAVHEVPLLPYRSSTIVAVDGAGAGSCSTRSSSGLTPPTRIGPGSPARFTHRFAPVSRPAFAAGARFRGALGLFDVARGRQIAQPNLVTVELQVSRSGHPALLLRPGMDRDLFDRCGWPEVVFERPLRSTCDAQRRE